MVDIIKKYFENLSTEQIQQIDSLYELYKEWNSKINVISRKDIENIYEHHILHSLSIAKLVRFKSGTEIMDFGTGGGFPGIPLAILCPDCKFMLVDSIGKKIRVATEVANAIGLKNVTFSHSRVQDIKDKYDFIVSRAVMPLPDMVKISFKNIKTEQNNAIANGWICLKGGDLENEISTYKKIVEITNINDFFEEEFFSTKKIVYLPYTGK